MSDNEYNSRDGDSPEETQRETVEDSLARLPAGPGAQSRANVDSDALEKLRQQVRHWGSDFRTFVLYKIIAKRSIITSGR